MKEGRRGGKGKSGPHDRSTTPSMTFSSFFSPPPHLPSLKIRSSISLKFSMDHEDDPGDPFPISRFSSHRSSTAATFLALHAWRIGAQLPLLPSLLSKSTRSCFLVRIIAENVRESLKRTVD